MKRCLFSGRVLLYVMISFSSISYVSHSFAQDWGRGNVDDGTVFWWDISSYFGGIYVANGSWYLHAVGPGENSEYQSSDNNLEFWMCIGGADLARDACVADAIMQASTQQMCVAVYNFVNPVKIDLKWARRVELLNELLPEGGPVGQLVDYSCGLAGTIINSGLCNAVRTGTLLNCLGRYDPLPPL